MASFEPKPETIEKLGLSVLPSFAMLAGMQLDVFTPLGDGPKNAEQIARVIGVGSAKLKPLLYALATTGLLTVEGDLFSNSPEADHFLVRGKSGFLGGRQQFYADRWNEALHAAESIRTGEPQVKHDFSLMSAGELRSFLGGLHPATLASGRHLVDRFDFSTVRSLLDVGGGSGGLAIAITEACPQLHATVLEIPTVAPITQEFVNEAGASDRIDIISEDVINGSLSGSYEVACLASFLQVLSPADASLALRNIYDALEPNGVVYIVGRILDDSRVSPTDVVGFNLVFISIYDEGQAYTEQEHRDWLDEAGFKEFERHPHPLPNGTSIISARKAG